MHPKGTCSPGGSPARWPLLLLVACGGPTFHRVGPAAPSALEIERITLEWSNAYVIRRGEAAVLVDSGSPGDRDALAAALAARSITPRAVVITHAHADHAGCARWLQTRGAAILLGAGDAPAGARGRNEPLVPTGLLGALLATVFMFPFEPFTSDVVVDRELDLAAYGLPDVVVVPVSGHTAGSIAVVAGTEAFVGDMLKGGELFERSPTEHLYQTDPAANLAALSALSARGLTRFYLGHRGPLDGAAVAAWLREANGDGPATAVSIELDVRGELPRDGDPGATAGLRLRYGAGRAGALGLGYTGGLDLRAGYLDGATYEADAHLAGLALRSAGGHSLALTAGAGLGGARRATASHAIVELAVELPAGPVHVLARASLGWVLGGPDYAGSARGPSDELSALVGVRLGRDRRWGRYVAGKGPYLAIGYRDLGGAELFGVALGLDLTAGR